jgi:hypothetical protein
MVIKFIQQFSTSASMAVTWIFGLMLFLLFLIFLGVGFAWWIGESLENMKAGFFIVGSVYAWALIIVALLARKVLLPIVRNLIIDKIYEED